MSMLYIILRMKEKRKKKIEIIISSEITRLVLKNTKMHDKCRCALSGLFFLTEIKTVTHSVLQ